MNFPSDRWRGGSLLVPLMPFAALILGLGALALTDDVGKEQMAPGARAHRQAIRAAVVSQQSQMPMQLSELLGADVIGAVLQSSTAEAEVRAMGVSYRSPEMERWHGEGHTIVCCVARFNSGAVTTIHLVLQGKVAASAVQRAVERPVETTLVVLHVEVDPLSEFINEFYENADEPRGLGRLWRALTDRIAL